MIVTFNEVKGKMPFPPMPLKDIKKVINFSQNVSNKQMKSAILLANASESTIENYKKKNAEKDLKITCKQVYEELNPKIEFLPELGLNNIRTYTLSSWDS
jgi:5-enolpyruvylshikimate-3-phosphate synthase